MPRPAPQSIDELDQLESSLVLPRFTADDAWELGCILRKRLVADYTIPAMISILLPTSSPTHPHHVLFHATSRSGTTPDNMHWISRKASTVLRFGRSSYNVGVKNGHDEEGFARKFGFWGTEESGRYAIHGGAVPVRVQGVEGIVAVAIVSGLKQDEDHMVVVEGLEELKKAMEKGA